MDKYIQNIGVNARNASHKLSYVTTNQKNDFLEILYYFKNANSLSMDSTNFELNDDEFDKIKEISQNVKNEILILFWRRTAGGV